MIGLWLEMQSDEVLERISDAQKWCAFTFGVNDIGCLKSNAGLPREGDGITARYDQLALRPIEWSRLVRMSGVPKENMNMNWGRPAPKFIWFINEIDIDAIRGPHVERLRTMIQNRARRILARRALAAHTPESAVLVET